MPDHDPRSNDDSLPAGPHYFQFDETVPEVPLEVIALPERPQPSNKWWVILSCIAYLILTQGIGFLVLYLIYAPQTGDYLMQNKEMMKTPEFAGALGPSILVAQIIGVIGSWIALRAVNGRDWARKVALRLPSWQHVVLALLAFPGMYVSAAGVDAVAREIFKAIHDQESLFKLEEMVHIFASWPLSFAILAVAVGPGFAEELFCRAFLGRGLVGNYGVVPGVILTSLFFGILHLEPRQVAYATLIGLVLHAAYVLTRSLWVPILLHTVNNGLSMVLLHLPKEVQEIGDKEPIPAYIFLGAAVLLLAVGWSLYQTRARLVSTSPELPAWRPDFPSVEYPPADSGAVVVRPAPGALHWAVALGGVLAFLATIAIAGAMRA